MRRSGLIVLALLAAVTTAFSQSEANHVSVANHPEERRYLVNGNGLALYLFKAGTQRMAIVREKVERTTSGALAEQFGARCE